MPDLLWILWFPARVVLISHLKLIVRRHQIITQIMTSHLCLMVCVCVGAGN